MTKSFLIFCLLILAVIVSGTIMFSRGFAKPLMISNKPTPVATQTVVATPAPLVNPEGLSTPIPTATMTPLPTLVPVQIQKPSINGGVGGGEDD